ncbi:MAG: serine/threonine protein kinase, partial [Chloroflexales bacterium]|nr:serine/threonine protein kinase [Chloroflexales bacterium]
MTSLIGRRLGRYEIRAELGRGGMARVYSAVDTQLQRQVAIKVLAAQLSLDEEFVRRFEREARTAANLRHPAIVTIYDVGEQDGLYYIAMELVSGRSLHAIIEERATLGLGYAVSLLDPVARALDYAHAQGAVHRDIKPHNILVDRDGRVLLTDFGIAQTPDSDGERLTRTGVFMGTPEYISPEQAEAQRVDGRSDLYSLAVVAYEVITGRVPFAGATPQLIVAHAQLPPPPPTSVLAHLPGELDEVLVRALAKRAERRYPSGAALIDALRNVAARYGAPLASREQLAGLAEAAGSPPAPP